MNEMMERVRNAVRDEYGSVLCAWTDMGTHRCCAINVPPHKCRCDAVARAAIDAMREPTEAMTSVRPVAALGGENYLLGHTNQAAVWRAMIDAVLTDSRDSGGRAAK